MEQTIKSLMCKLYTESADIPGMPCASRLYMRLEPVDWASLANATQLSGMREKRENVRNSSCCSEMDELQLIRHVTPRASILVTIS